MDIDEVQANELAKTGLLQKYGFYRPMMSHTPGHKFEPWHIEKLAEKIAAVAPTSREELLNILKSAKKVSPVFTGKIEKPLSQVYEGKITKEDPLEAAQKIMDTIPEAFFGWQPPTKTVREIGRLAKMNIPKLSQPFWQGITGTAKIIEDVSTALPRALGYEGKTSRILSSFPQKMLEMASPPWAEPKTRTEEIATLPGRVTGEILSYLGPGTAAKALTATQKATFGVKYARNLMTFLGNDLARGYEAEGIKGVEGALKTSPATAGLFTVAGAIPGGNLVKSIASGSAFAGAAALQGETRPDRLAESFATGAGLHWLLERQPSYNVGKIFDYLKKGVDESKLGKSYEQLKFDLRRQFAADSISPEAKKTGMVWVDKLNQSFADYFRRSKAMGAYRTEFGKLDEDTRWRLSSIRERGEELPAEFRHFKPYFDARQEMFDHTYNIITNELKKELDYTENYAAHLYKNPKLAKEVLLRYFGGTPLRGSRRFFKERKILDMDTARRLGLEPLFDNPVDQDLAGYLEQQKYITYHKVRETYKKMRYIKYFENGSKFIPGDWTDLKDPSFHTDAGRYWAPVDVAAVINNHFSPGVQNLWYTKYHNFTAAWNAWHVFSSLYHGMTTTMHAYSTAMGEVPSAFGRLLTGEIKQPLKIIARAPVAPLNYFDFGRRKMKGAFYAPGKSPDMDFIVNAAISGGYRPEHIHPMQQGTASGIYEFLQDLDAMVTGPKRLQKLGKNYRSMIRAVSSPLMSHWVPNIKWGIMGVRLQDKYGEIIKRYGDKPMSVEQENSMMRELQELAYDERKFVENAFGELSMDQQQMSAGIKKALKSVIGYPGWNKGTLGLGWNAVVRGPYQIGRQFVQAARGETPQPLDYSARRGLEFGMGLIMTNAIVNGIMQKILIGEWPESWEDAIIGARTGKFHSNGAPIRVSMASYMKDGIGAAVNFPAGAIQMAKNKLMFAFTMANELATNRDWRNEVIFSPATGKPWAERQVQHTKELGDWLGRHLETYSMSQSQQAKVPWMKWGTFFGATQRSRAASNSPMQQSMDDWFARKRGAMTHEEAAIADKKKELRDLYRSGEMDKFETSLQEAISQKLMKASQEKNLRKELDEPELPATFKKITDLREAMNMFKLGSDDEKRQVADVMWAKIQRSKSETKEELEEQIDSTIEELDRVEGAAAPAPSKEDLLNILKQGR